MKCFQIQVSLYALEEALEGRIRQIPFNAIQALDVVMRHLVSTIFTFRLVHSGKYQRVSKVDETRKT